MRRNKKRSGVAATEFAIILPLIVILGIVPLELCNLIHVKQSVAVAAYEAVKAASRPAGDELLATDAYTRVMTDRGIKSSSIDINPDLTVVTPGEEVSVTVSAPFSDNSFFHLWFIDCQPTTTVTMTRE
jgi:Flp pilus assembly protein TadG